MEGNIAEISRRGFLSFRFPRVGNDAQIPQMEAIFHGQIHLDADFQTKNHERWLSPSGRNSFVGGCEDAARSSGKVEKTKKKKVEEQDWEEEVGEDEQEQEEKLGGGGGGGPNSGGVVMMVKSDRHR